MKTGSVNDWVASACIFVSVLIAVSCSKSSSSESIFPIVTDTTIEPVESPFGVMIEGVPAESRLVPIKALAVKDVRAETPVASFSGDNPYLDSLVKNGYRINLNFDYYGSATSAPFVTDLTALTTGITTILQTYKPAIATVENEETDEVHTGRAQDYINELSAATTVFHNNNIKVTNGGLTEDILCVLTYRNYLSVGQTAKANDFAKRCMPPAIISDLPDLANNPTLASRTAFADTLIKAYRSMSFDYINFHWYEPVIERWPDAIVKASDTLHVNTQAMTEVMSFLQTATAKPVISTEAGELYNATGIVTDMMQQFKTSNIPLVIWYSGDGRHKTDNAVALNNADGSLRANGIAFLNFLKANYK